jgi:hypothetical protein
VLARLDADGVRLVPMARAVEFRPGAVELAHSYSGRRWTLGGIGTVVLACGSVSDDALYHALRTQHRAVHLLGAAYAPDGSRSPPARPVTWYAPYSPKPERGHRPASRATTGANASMERCATLM